MAVLLRTFLAKAFRSLDPLAAVTTYLVLGTALLLILWGRDRVYRTLFVRSSWKRRDFDLYPSNESSCKLLISEGNIFSRDSNILQNNLSSLQARAFANQRLVHVFGISNAFTTTDEERKNEIKHNVLNHLRRLPNTNWMNLAQSARLFVRSEIAYARTDDGQGALELMPFVQSVTLKIALIVMFEKVRLQSHGMPDPNIATIAREINRLWVESKSADLEAEVPPFHQQNELRYALSQVLPNNPLDTADDNPLNVIIPAYESIWRIVLLGAIECLRSGFPEAPGPLAHVQKSHAALVRDPLVTFLANPAVPSARLAEASAHTSSGGENGDSKTSNSTRALYIARETLRLYPSTRRVYRAFESAPSLVGLVKGQTVECAARVSELHTSAEIWGEEDRLGFDPGRWAHLVSQRHVAHNTAVKGYVPFGVYPYNCPAGGSGFGFKIIALLVAAVCEGVWDTEKEKHDADVLDGGGLEDGEECLAQTCRHWAFEPSRLLQKVPLPSGREDARDWRIVWAAPDGTTGCRARTGASKGFHKRA